MARNLLVLPGSNQWTLVDGTHHPAGSRAAADRTPAGPRAGQL
jgi:hypothetical protein